MSIIKEHIWYLAFNLAPFVHAWSCTVTHSPLCSPLPPCSHHWPPAHPHCGAGDEPGPGGAGGRPDPPVPPAERRHTGLLRRRPLQPHQLWPQRADGEEHPGVGHGAERAGRVAQPLPKKKMIFFQIPRCKILARTEDVVAFNVCCVCFQGSIFFSFFCHFWTPQKKIFRMWMGCVERSRFMRLPNFFLYFFYFFLFSFLQLSSRQMLFFH